MAARAAEHVVARLAAPTGVETFRAGSTCFETSVWYVANRQGGTAGGFAPTNHGRSVGLYGRTERKTFVSGLGTVWIPVSFGIHPFSSDISFVADRLFLGILVKRCIDWCFVV